ncbi:MAG TPA: hypothetical protein VM053_12050 [Gemmatimonadaceae bacterium]|nr:hypothetical protein [Gemmatimonadaceae bacterium]
MKLGRKTTCLSSEDKHDIARLAERGVPEKLRCFGREEPWRAERRQLELERFPARPHLQIDVLPVVEPRALHLALVE